MAPPMDANLLVGIETSDDAAVYRLTNDLAMVNTIDIITPPVDDPYWYGQIAAANAISDIYSMGGRPVTALNLIMFPTNVLDIGLMKDILRGGHDKVMEAGASLAGGHSVDDEEPKYGLCVSGIVHPDRIITNAGARSGDAIVLTKPLGSGVLFNAVRSGRLPYSEIEASVLPIVAALNARAMETALEFELHAATDITGFGIAGHLLGVARGSNKRINLDYHALPVFTNALEMYKKGETTGSNESNRQLTRGMLEFQLSLTASEEELLYDPQTSGGLVLILPAEQAEELVTALVTAGVQTAVRIGEVVEGQPGINII